MKLGCFQSNRGLRQMEFADFAQAVADLGYDSIDVPPLNDAAVALCRELGLTIFATGAVVPADLSPDPDRQAQIIQTMTQAIDWAAANGVGVITHLIGRDVSRNGDDNLAIFKEVYTPIAAHGEAAGVRLAFENWPRNGTMLAISPELWAGMFNAVPSPTLGLCYDPSHFFWLGIDYIDPIREFGQRIYHAHAKDTEILTPGRNRFGIYGRQLSSTAESSWWRYRLPGYGAVNWHSYLDTLYQVGYNGVISVEHEDPVWDSTSELALRGLKLSKQFLDPFLA